MILNPDKLNDLMGKLSRRGGRNGQPPGRWYPALVIVLDFDKVMADGEPVTSSELEKKTKSHECLCM